MAALLPTRLSHPVDVCGRGREVEVPFALLLEPPGAPAVSARPTDDANSAADVDTISRLLRAATTSAALSIVCTGTKATEESVGATSPAGSVARWGCRRTQPLPEAARSLFLVRPPFGLGSVWPLPRPSPTGKGEECAVGDSSGLLVEAEGGGGERGGRSETHNRLQEKAARQQESETLLLMNDHTRSR